MCKSPLYAVRPRLLVSRPQGEDRLVLEKGVVKCRHFSYGEVAPFFSDEMLSKKRSLVFYKSFDDWEFQRVKDPYSDFLRLPCGQCIECRLSYSKEWATRIVCESLTSEGKNLFVTLTYDDEHIHLVPSGLSTLVYKDLQDFLKRLREYCARVFSHQGIRFYACGEYGSSSARSHFHVCLFNLPDQIIDEMTFYKSSFNGDCYYISDLLSRLWGNGFVVCADLVYQSAAYVARYVCKKWKGSFRDELSKLGISNQESRMSLKPGIGQKYYQLFKDDIYRNDEIFLPSVGRVNVCSYFDRLYEFDNPVELSIIKSERVIHAENYLKNKLNQTDLTELELMASELKSLESRVKKLDRPL